MRPWPAARGVPAQSWSLIAGERACGRAPQSNSYLHGCPCGYAGDPVRECTCSASAITRYAKRLSGPLLDRIDIHLDVPRI